MAAPVGVEPNAENKLFVGGCPPGSNEDDLRRLFEEHGTVEEVFIMRGGSRSGMACAFVRFSTQEQAVAAIEAIHGQHKLPDASEPLVVRWADAPGSRRREGRDGGRGGGYPMGAMNFGPMGPYGAYPMSQMMMGQQHGMGGAGPYGGGYYPQQQQGGMPHGGGMPPMNPTMMGYPQVPVMMQHFLAAQQGMPPHQWQSSGPPSPQQQQQMPMMSLPMMSATQQQQLVDAQQVNYASMGNVGVGNAMGGNAMGGNAMGGNAMSLAAVGPPSSIAM